MAALETSCAWLPKVPCRKSRDPGSCATAAAAACATGEAAGAATRGAWEAEEAAEACGESSDSECDSASSSDGSEVEADASWARRATLVAEHRELGDEAAAWRGVPRSARRREWATLSGAAALAAAAGCVFDDGSLGAPECLRCGLAALGARVAPAVAADVALDARRGGARSRRCRRVVRRVLLGVAVSCPETGYCQGLNVICTTILGAVGDPDAPTAADEALAFWLLKVLVSERCAGWWAGDLGRVSRDAARVLKKCAAGGAEIAATASAATLAA